MFEQVMLEAAVISPITVRSHWNVMPQAQGIICLLGFYAAFKLKRSYRRPLDWFLVTLLLAGNTSGLSPQE